ncbi:MAG: LamG-like jellyroll fold domain-containing protein [Chitinophagaceae bacterium]
MRTIILIFVWLSLSASALSQNLVAYYPFTGNANDQSGNGINPTYIGAGVTLTTDRFGYANNAYNFNGTTNSYMRMPADLLPTTNRTISLWFNVTDVTNRPGLLGYGGNGSCGTTLLMGLNLLGAGQYYVQGHCGNNAAGYAYPAAPLNNWYHWVLTINGSVQKIYVNGQLKSTDNTFGGSTAVSGKDFSLGAITSISGTTPYTDANVDYLNGKLDDVRIYDAAMSDAQVLQLYNNELTGLVAYYPFNGDANDESGNGYNGVVSGAFLTSDRFEQTGKAYNFTFNGTSSDKIQVAGTSGLNFSSGGFSVSGWFRFTGTAGAGNNYPIFSKHNCGEQSGYIVMLYNDKITFWMAGAGGYSYLSTPESYTDGQWHHVAAVYDGATRYIFIDGQQKISDAFAYTVPNGANWALGGYNGCNGGFNGKVDEIRVYSRGLTPAEILQQYKSESTGLVAYYPFNGNANDESGNGNNGTVIGATLTTDRFGNANKAYSFTNPNHIEVPNSNLLGDEFTLSYWFKIDYYPGQRGVMSNVAIPNGGFQQAFDGTTFSYILGYNFPQTSDPLYSNYTMQEPLSQWHHLAVTYKKTGTSLSESKLFINGELKKSSNHIGLSILFTPNATFYIGQNHSGLNFQGDLDDIRIYNRNLSPNEIQQLADIPMMPELLAYLPMNGNANDKSGNNHDGTVVNAPPATDKYDNSNSAYQFNGNGTGTNITLANSTSLDFYENFSGRPFSLSAWVNLGTNTGEPRQIIGKHNCGTPNGYILLVENGKLGFWMSVSGTWFPLTTTETYNDGKWHHVVATYDVTYQRLYIDGVLKGSMLTAYNNPAYGALVKIGEPNGCGGLGILNGKVDEVKIYGSALDANQVTALHKQSRGSGNALNFDGVDDHIVTNEYLVPTTGDFTVELWVYNRNINGFREFISQGWGPNAFYIGTANSTGYIRLGDTWATTVELPQNKWVHLAVVKSGFNGVLYMDGIQVATSISYSVGAGGTQTQIGKQYGPHLEYADAFMDEIRIWNTALSAPEVRDWMNRKITPNHPTFSNLVSYYNFDEKNVLLTYEVKGAKTGMLVNGPQYITSGAPIGDASVHNIANPLVPATLTLPTGENFSALQGAGTALGLYVYVVKDPPEIQTGILGLGSNDHYFGVKKVEMPSGTTASYTATYNYTGNTVVSPATEPTLQLFKRDNNSVKTWTNSGASLNTTANTLIVAGQNTEYILGSSGFGLPVTLLSFQAQKINTTTAKLTWQTATEVNNKGFEVQRSFDGNYFTAIQFVNGAGNANEIKDYSSTDVPGRTGRVFYRLKQVDLDGNSKLSNIVSVLFEMNGMVKVYPNPAQRQITIEGVEPYNRIQLVDAMGKLIKDRENKGQYQLQINLEGVRNGMYLLRLMNEKEVQTVKLIIAN